MTQVQSVMFFAGNAAGHYIEFRNDAWVIRHKNFQPTNVEKVYPNIVSALSELERVSKISSSSFTVGYKNMAIVPLRRVG